MKSSVRKAKLQRIRSGAAPRVADLFAGAGGLTLGFVTAGFQPILAVENDSHAAATHAFNFFSNLPEDERHKHALARDIRMTEPEQLLAEYGYTEPAEAVDIVIGGPPCQAFARVGRAKLREVAEHPEAFLQDPRSNLYLRFLHYVEAMQPVAVLMENVPDALNYGGHNIAEETCETLAEMGYRCGYTLLNSAFYGVPQMRERMFIVAWTEEIETPISFIDPTHWVVLPSGYSGTRSVALKSLRQKTLPFLPELDSETQCTDEAYFVVPPEPAHNLPHAVTAYEALKDLPPLYSRQMLKNGTLFKGPQSADIPFCYMESVAPSIYGKLMRNWPGFETKNSSTGHIIRFLPRDYKLFERMNHGDQYPQAYQHAQDLFHEELNRRKETGSPVYEGTNEYEQLKSKFVPPYDPGKFPNKWRKMEPDQPARTLMAHIGKDSYSHIHYDSEQARTISVREAARLQSFPDGFSFVGKMNSAFRQVGNAVPPLLAWQIAKHIKQALTTSS